LHTTSFKFEDIKMVDQRRADNIMAKRTGQKVQKTQTLVHNILHRKHNNE